jgi:IS1 family transposase
VLDGAWGARDPGTCKKRDDRRQPGPVRRYWTGADQVSRAVIPEKRLAMRQWVTKAIARNHPPKRHWCARCKRKSMVVSRSLEMVALTRALFATCPVHGHDSPLLASLNL